MTEALHHIPTNIITGFLGVGKTTAISHLLSIKPASERWAVLVNEFGEIGIDGSLLQGQHAGSEQVFVAEVPGGCMCCVMGLPTKVTLNRLLQQAKPDRLLIEPTGLGHPQEVLELLRSQQYREVLDVRNTLTLVDARVVSDQRYTEHAIFNQQLEIADIIVANKTDCYDGELAQLNTYLSELRADRPSPVMPVERGQIALEWLDWAPLEPAVSSDHHLHDHDHDHDHPAQISSEQSIPAQGYIESRNHKGDYYSRGWRFDEAWIFDHARLQQALESLKCERMKAVFLTSLGPRGYSLSQGVLTEVELKTAQGSRIELLDREPERFTHILAKLLAASSDTRG